MEAGTIHWKLVNPTYLRCVEDFAEGDPVACLIMDVNNDGILDMIDWRALQVLFTVPEQP